MFIDNKRIKREQYSAWRSQSNVFYYLWQIYAIIVNPLTHKKSLIIPTFIIVSGFSTIFPIISSTITINQNKLCLQYIEDNDHDIRELVADHLVKPVHVSAIGMRADIMTKFLPRKSFLQGRSFLFSLLNSDAFSFDQELKVCRFLFIKKYFLIKLIN